LDIKFTFKAVKMKINRKKIDTKDQGKKTFKEFKGQKT
jgi:hypothetical protein